jgi:deoxyribose-phosphate aldolase
MDDVTVRIEHTVLGPTTRWADVSDRLDDALRHGMRACVPPQHVAQAVEYAPGVPVTTVVGFPHGQHAVDTKVAAARAAVDAGAAEVDLVPDHGQLLAGEDAAYRTSIAEVVASVPVPVKVIVETGLLDADQRERAARAAAEADAAFLKTSTGVVAGGATVGAVEALAEHLPVKASGGIDTWPVAAAMFEAGAERIGASAGAAIVEEYEAASGSE